MTTPFAEIILERMRVLGDEGRPLSLREVSKLTEKYKGGPISHTTIGDYINGTFKAPNPARVRILADALAGSDMGGTELYEKLLESTGRPVTGTGVSVIDIPEVAMLEHAELNLVKDLIRALVRARAWTPPAGDADDGPEEVATRRG